MGKSQPYFSMNRQVDENATKVQKKVPAVDLQLRKNAFCLKDLVVNQYVVYQNYCTVSYGPKEWFENRKLEF